MAYMFVHDGLVHKLFPVRAHHNTAAVTETVQSSQVGPLANVPFMKRVAAAHMLHHADKYEGKPFGMLLGPQVCRDSHPRPLCFPTSYLSTVAGASPHSWSSGRIGEVGVRFVTSNIAISLLPPRFSKIFSGFVSRNGFKNAVHAHNVRSLSLSLPVLTLHKKSREVWRHHRAPPTPG